MNEDLQQQLMEFVYGLLDEDEANALCERITSDPQLARAYSKVKLQCDLVARAARCDIPTVAWVRPDGTSSSSSPVQTASNTLSAAKYRRLTNWCIGVAASGLLCLMGSAYWLSHRSTSNGPTMVAFELATPVQVVLTGPSKLHAEADNPFTIQVADDAGTPVSTTLNYRVYDARGGVSWEDSASTDEFGIARFDVEASIARDASRLEIAALDAAPAPILRPLEAAPDRFATYLRMDRPLFRPGEPVLYRSVTLSRFGLRAESEVTTSFEIVDSNGEQLAGSAKTVETKRGVGFGSFTLPSDLPDGIYALIARTPNALLRGKDEPDALIASSPDTLFHEEWREFQVRRFETPKLLKKLELAQDSYTAGDQVELDYFAKRVAGEPLSEVPLEIQASIDGIALATPQAKTDTDGNARFSVRLPESIERGRASVSVRVQDGDDPAETISKDVPINLGKVNVDFYPEGGDLVAALPSRVYFYGRDPLGKPTHIEGYIADSSGSQITNVVTGHEGRGKFSFTPRANEQYRLIIDKPEGVTKEVPLPVASVDHFVTIHSGLGVFAANAPITFTLFHRTPVRPLTVAAYCRGAMIGQQAINPNEYVEYTTAYSKVNCEMELSDHAQGVIRLTVFDTSSTPPTPVAERLVYRRVGQQLDVRITPDAETFAPGQSVELTLDIRDENDVPVPAALGIAVVDDAVLNLADDKSTRMPTYFHLLTEIDSPEQLDDANFYLSDDPESADALDSLLGTQGWRRFTELPAMQLAGVGGGGFGRGGFGGGASGLSFDDGAISSRFRSLAWTDELTVPVSTATTMDVEKVAFRQSTRSARAPASNFRSLAVPMIVAGIVVLSLVGVASLQWSNDNRALRVFAAAVAVVSLVVGVLSLPRNSIRVAEVTDNAAPAAVEFAERPSEQETAIATVDAQMQSEATDAIRSDRFRYAPDEQDALFGTPMNAPAEVMPGEPAAPSPKAVSRDATKGQQPGREDDDAVSEKPADSPLNKMKEAAKPSPEATPQPAAAAEGFKRQTLSGNLARRALTIADESKSLADKNERTVVTREYANWFYYAGSSNPATDNSSSTIVWMPLHVAQETGKASIFFQLPPHPSSVRAIVEAHGADRLGANELLIDSR